MQKASSVHTKIFRAVVSVAGAGIVVKVIAMVKEIAVADVFGRSRVIDAFLLAMLIPGLLVNLISESMSQALIPTLIRVREQEGHGRAQELLSGSMLWMCGLLVAVCGGMALVVHVLLPVIRSLLSVDVDLAARIFYVLLPVVVLTGVASNCTAVLNASERFVLPALAPAVISIVTIGALLVFGGRYGIWSMVWANIAGALIYAVAVIKIMRAHGYSFCLRWHGMTDAIREVAGQYGPVFLSGVVASGGLVVDQVMAARLPTGSVAALAYANRFVSVVLSLLAVTVSTAVTPYFSRMLADHDWIGCQQVLRMWAKITAAVSVPVAIGMMVGGRWMVRMTLQHGTFHAVDTVVVAFVLAMYAIQIPFYVTSRVHYRFLIAMRRSDVVFYCGLINLTLDAVLNIVCMRWLGVAGIALATSLWSVSTFFFLRYWAWRCMPVCVERMEEVAVA